MAQRDALRLSVVVCTYSRSRELESLLRSLANQERLPDEVVIVDSSADDRTESLVRKRSPSDGLDLVYVRSARGLTFQRNVGIDHARGDIVIFLDDDMSLDPGCLRTLAARFDSDVDHSIGGVTGYDRQNMGRPFPSAVRLAKKLGMIDCDLLGGKVDSAGIFISLQHYHPNRQSCRVDFLPGCFMAFRQEVLEEFRPPLKIKQYGGEDKYFSSAVRRKWELEVLPDALCVHRPGRGHVRPSGFSLGFSIVTIHLTILQDVISGGNDRSSARLRLYFAFTSMIDLLYDVLSLGTRPFDPEPALRAMARHSSVLLASMLARVTP